MTDRDLDVDPLHRFAAWLDDAAKAGIALPEAMALATATADGSPSARMVLLNGLDEDGLVFFSGYESRKGRELAANPRGALLFYWQELGRQVRIEGPVERVSAEESDRYFATRPHGSRLSAAASPQSDVIESREVLEARVEKLRDRYEGGDVPRPPDWGGYRLAPHSFEFWQHREDRLHDRLRYRREHGRWLAERLAP